ncbi:MAG TPA: HAMP domain-containing sensor histidine kinase [Solirubrobacteraceae bacterium]|nr:HAMP domain-containing sensor histidine kinase [Solirubrobacteraceae bacterium]
MTLRRRVGLAAGAAVAVAVILMAGISYWVVRDQLRGQVDDALRAQATAILRNPFTLEHPVPGIPASAGGPAPYVQFVAADGTTLPRMGGLTLPAPPGVAAVAAGNAPAFLSDVQVGGSHLREFTFRDPSLAFSGQGVAVQLARPLSSVDNVLHKLRLILVVLVLGGIALALVLGRLAARRVLAPLAEVADTAQHISETEDLTARIHVHSEDEVGQLATRFNAMLARLGASRNELDESVRAQRQLVADASHELRTPITSLRTNIELLLQHPDLTEEERGRMLADVVEQTEELSGLIGDLIELARGDLPPDAIEDVRLDQVVAECLTRARRNFPHIRYETRLAPVLIPGTPERLGRAVNNLLDNAARHSPHGGTVEVDVDQTGVRVRDHGPGVAEDDLPYVFDRFYRGASSRGKQGSGLGLAIVRQVAEQHHGSVEVVNAPDGGAVFTLRLPLVAAEASGDGWLDEPALPGVDEPLAQEPEEDPEHREHDQEQRPAAQRSAD